MRPVWDLHLCYVHRFNPLASNQETSDSHGLILNNLNITSTRGCRITSKGSKRSIQILKVDWTAEYKDFHQERN